MKGLLLRILALVLMLVLPWTTCAQQGGINPKQAAKVKRKVETLAPNAPISVIPERSREEYGRFLSSDADSFTFYDIDLKSEVTLKYVDVRKVKNGYGGYNSIQNRHTDRTKAVIVVIALVGALGGLIAAAASAKN
jgi:hypothetical protein